MKKRGLMGLLAVGLLAGLLLPASVPVLADSPICGSTYATDWYDYYQGTEKDGSPVGGVDAFRTDPDSAVGPLVLDPLRFFSLGRNHDQQQVEGGWIILEFPTYVGTCLTIVEASPTVGTYPEERAKVYVSADPVDPQNWTLIGEATNLAPDLGTVGNEPSLHPNVFGLQECIKFVKIVDITPWGSHPYGVADGFDVDAVYAGICPEPAIEIEKSADVLGSDNNSVAHEGDQVLYTYTVTNTGNVPLLDVTVVDTPLGDVTLTSGLTDEDADMVDDDLAVGAFATGTLSHIVDTVKVGGSDADPLENIASASALYSGEPVTDESNSVSIDVLHPAIEVAKETDEVAYFNGTPVTYTITVENTGDCTLYDVTLVDEEILDGPVLIGELAAGGEWIDDFDHTWVCTGETMTPFTNRAFATGEDVLGMVVEDKACWTLLIFQWQPRTIGYWGNWDNHWTTEEFGIIYGAADGLSANIPIDANWNDNTTDEIDVNAAADVQGFLLGKPPKFDDKDVKAWFLMHKQLLATWLNVANFIAAPDASMDSNAMVYLTRVDGAVALFGDAEALTVSDLLAWIEGHKTGWDAGQLGIAQEVLDMMNNGENNSYYMFVDPDFEADVCPCVQYCVNFCTVDPGTSVEGLDTVQEGLNIQAVPEGRTAIKVLDGVAPKVYGAPNPASFTNKGVDAEKGGFSDAWAADHASAHGYTFTFADGIAVSEFSLRMLDFGDYNPTRSRYHYAVMIAYDGDGAEVDRMELEYNSDGLSNPRSSDYDDLYYTGDAVGALEGEPGNWIWSVSGAGIEKVELSFGAGFDPKIAFDKLCYTICG